MSVNRSTPVAIVVAMLLSTVAGAAEKFPGDAERKARMSPEELAWEELLEENLGKFYLPRYKAAKAKGHETAWDYVKDDPKLPKVLLIGDSISRGYTLPVRHALKGKVNVHRAPENCGKSAHGLKKLDVWLGDRQWDLIHFNFGIHDKRFDPHDHADRLEMIVERLKGTGARLIFATSTPLSPTDDFRGACARLNEIDKTIMKKHGVAVNDLYALIYPHLEKYQNPTDCHFKQEGYELLGRQVAAKISEALKKGPPKWAAGRGAGARQGEELIFADNFDRGQLGDAWRVVRGAAAVKDQTLRLKGPAVVTVKPDNDTGRLGRNLRVEYDAVSDDPGDLSLLLNVSNGGDAYNQYCVSTGYFFGVATGGNQGCKILAFGKELARSDTPELKPGKVYHITLEKKDGQLRTLVDGQEVVKAGEQKLAGAGSLGFYVWTSRNIDNLKVYDLGP